MTGDILFRCPTHRHAWPRCSELTYGVERSEEAMETNYETPTARVTAETDLDVERQADDVIAAAIKALEACRETSFAASSDAIRINAILW